MKRCLYRIALLGLATSLLYCNQKLRVGEKGCESDGECEGSSGGRPACGFGDDCMNVNCAGCNVHSCRSDTDCGPNTTCKSCGNGGGICWNSCTGEEQCGYGYACVDQRCGLKPCTEKADCAVNFECTPEGCKRVNCTSDEECVGYCVRGQCIQTQGKCFIFDV